MKVLLAANEGDRHFGLITGLGLPGVEVVTALTPDEIGREIVDAEVVYGFPNESQVASARNLKWVQSPGAGVDWVTRNQTLVERDIVVTNTRGAHGPSIAEHVFAMLFQFTRHLPECAQLQRDHRWDAAGMYRKLTEINGGTMGIVGYGQIGQAVARRAVAFGMDVLAVDANPVAGAPYVDQVWPVARLHDLLAASDVVVLALPLTRESHHLVDAAALGKMKPTSYLIAISRGGIVDEGALLSALTQGRIAGAGLDVTETEPLPPDDLLWDAPNLLITPHLAGASDPKERRCVEIFRDNLIRYVNGEPLQNIVDKVRGY